MSRLRLTPFRSHGIQEKGDPRTLLFDQALDLLKKGRAPQKLTPFLQSLHARFPDDEQVLLNYGMSFSDQGRLEDATRLLRTVGRIGAWAFPRLDSLGRGPRPKPGKQ